MPTDQLELPDDRRVYLTLDLECDYGTALGTSHYNAVQHADQLAAVLESHDVPLSCFLQTQILEECPETIDPFLSATVPVEFHAHSHTHPPRASADVPSEVAESVRRVRERFDTEPIGFRFPDGAAQAGDYAVLADHDVAFSSSVFPSWRPGRFNNLRGSREPYRVSEIDVVELPFTVYSDFLRIPVSLSYLKLFGAAFERLVTTRPPRIIIFDFHMHDLVVPSTYSDLSAPYRAVYARNKYDGLAMLDRIIGRLQKQGCTFGRISDLYDAVAGADFKDWTEVTDTDGR